MRHPRVLVVSLGGTMAMTGSAGKAVIPSLDAAELVRGVPELARIAEISVRSFGRVPGAHLRFASVVALAHEITSAFRDGFAGVVVTQGTDTIEEVAFALDLLVKGEASVVVTGAMRSPSQPGADGPANLLDAVRVAAADSIRGLGTTVVFGGEIHAARFVRKTHSINLHAFTSVTGPLGWLAEGMPQILVRPVSRPHVRLTEDRTAAIPPVSLVTIPVDDDGRLIPAIKDLAYEGLVVEALGAGHVPAVMVSELEILANRIPVVLCSRTGRGPVLRRTYGFVGSEKDLLDRGLISGGYLDGRKARVALTLLLRGGAAVKDVKDFFRDEFGALP